MNLMNMTVTKTEPTPKARLISRMKTEQELYNKRLQEMKSSVRSRYTVEYRIRNQIVDYIEFQDVSLLTVERLLLLKAPVAIIFMEFDKYFDIVEGLNGYTMAGAIKSSIDGAESLVQSVSQKKNSRLAHLLIKEDIHEISSI